MWSGFSFNLLHLLLLLLLHRNNVVSGESKVHIICCIQCTGIIGSFESRGDNVLLTSQTFEGHADDMAGPTGTKQMMSLKLRQVRTHVLVNVNRSKAIKPLIALSLASVPFKTSHDTVFIFERERIRRKFVPHPVAGSNDEAIEGAKLYNKAIEGTESYTWAMKDLVLLLGDEWKKDMLGFTNLDVWHFLTKVFSDEWLTEERDEIRRILRKDQTELSKQNFYGEFEVANYPMQSKVLADDAETFLTALLTLREDSISQARYFMRNEKQNQKRDGKQKGLEKQVVRVYSRPESFLGLRIKEERGGDKLLRQPAVGSMNEASYVACSISARDPAWFNSPYYQDSAHHPTSSSLLKYHIVYSPVFVAMEHVNHQQQHPHEFIAFQSANPADDHQQQGGVQNHQNEFIPFQSTKPVDHQQQQHQLIYPLLLLLLLSHSSFFLNKYGWVPPFWLLTLRNTHESSVFLSSTVFASVHLTPGSFDEPQHVDNIYPDDFNHHFVGTAPLYFSPHQDQTASPYTSINPPSFHEPQHVDNYPDDSNHHFVGTAPLYFSAHQDQTASPYTSINPASFHEPQHVDNYPDDSNHHFLPYSQIPHTYFLLPQTSLHAQASLIGSQQPNPQTVYLHPQFWHSSSANAAHTNQVAPHHFQPAIVGSIADQVPPLPLLPSSSTQQQSHDQHRSLPVHKETSSLKRSSKHGS